MNDLLDRVVNLVVADDPRKLAERTLEVVLTITGGRRAAAFKLDGERLSLYSSQALDQAVLDAVPAAWAVHRAELVQGRPVCYPGAKPPAEIQQALTQAGSLVIYPVIDDGRPVALMFADSSDLRLATESGLAGIASLAKLIARAVSIGGGPAEPPMVAIEDFLEKSPADQIARAQLLLLLERNEWNIARVARLMQISRRTIYMRLERYGIERRRVVKSRRRNKQPA